MATDPRKLRPSELCLLLNSTPLGEVISEQQLHRHRTRAGMRIGDGRHVDLVRYVAWLVQLRHAPKPQRDGPAETTASLLESAQGAAVLASERQLHSHGQKLTSKQEAVIAALLTENSYLAAAGKAGVSPATVYRWMRLPTFRTAYRQARRELVEAAVGRMQAATGQAIDALLHVARQGRRDGDRVRAAVALLDRAFQGLAEADTLHGEPPPGEASDVDTADVVKVVATRLQQLNEAELSTAEKSRLTATLADALLRAIGVDVLDKRLAALQDVLVGRKEKKP